MMTIEGKYNTAEVFTDVIEESAILQIKTLLNQEFVDGSKIRIMPDVHSGAGCTIGTTMTIKDKVVPNLVGVDIGCLDKDTEILTPDGWIKISDYNNEKILVYESDTDKAYFDYPIAYIKNPCKEFYHLYTSKGLDMMVSEDHTIMYWSGYDKINRELKFQQAKSFVEHHNSLNKGIAGGIKTTFDFKNNVLSIYDKETDKILYPNDNEIKVWVMFSADGRIKGEHSAKETANGMTANRANFHFKKERKIKRCKELLELCNFSYDVSYSKDGSVTINAYIPKYMTKSLKPFYNASKYQLYVLACESLMWDGYKHNSELDYCKKDFYSTTKKENADVVQFAFASNNIRCGIFSPKMNEHGNLKQWSKSYNVYVTNNIFVGFPAYNFQKVSSKDGYEYCFTTNTGSFIIRRNDSIQISHNCGMEVAQIKESHIELQKLDKVIRKNIPAGFEIRQNEPHRFYDDIDLTPLRCYHDVNIQRAKFSLGTLGGGNHFIEADKDDDGNIYIVIHSGSRHLGLEVAKYYQNQAIRDLDSPRTEDIKNLVAEYKEQGRQTEIQDALMHLMQSYENPVPKSLCYLRGSLLDSYIYDMKIIQKFAKLNRKAMMDEIVKGMHLHIVDEFTTIHNYIDTDYMILRKGAVSARKGEKLIIPINMRDGSLICTGKGNDDWNQSAPHGAGRLMSRRQAKESFTVSEFKKTMDGIYSTSINSETLDECPMAYKSIDDIVDNIGDTVDIVKTIKPIYSFKAGNEEK